MQSRIPGKKFKVGVLGGGQLGRMLVQSAINWDVHLKMLDPDPQAPCHAIATEFVCGSLTDKETVLAFGKDLDVLTIEIENVNTEAMEELQKQGVKVFPQPEIIRLIQDKRTQKSFYLEHGIPTSPFHLIESKEELQQFENFLPFVQKMGKEGYDGKGVQVMESTADFEKGFEVPSLIEEKVDIDVEISVIVARNENGEIAFFPAVELVYHPEHNLVDYLSAPARISEEQETRARELAKNVIEKMDIVGILAVEMFIAKSGEILVNEVAPRPHNSGHQTIEANITSQYEQHLRSILNLPLGDTTLRCPAAMVNILGAAGQTGETYYAGLHKALAEKGVYPHVYGKVQTKPFRKMGHVTIIADSRDELLPKIEMVKKTVQTVAKEHLQ